MSDMIPDRYIDIFRRFRDLVCVMFTEMEYVYGDIEYSETASKVYCYALLLNRAEGHIYKAFMLIDKYQYVDGPLNSADLFYGECNTNDVKSIKKVGGWK